MAVYISVGVVAAVSVMVLIPLILYTQRKMRDRQSTGMNTFILFSLCIFLSLFLLYTHTHIHTQRLLRTNRNVSFKISVLIFQTKSMSMQQWPPLSQAVQRIRPTSTKLSRMTLFRTPFIKPFKGM